MSTYFFKTLWGQVKRAPSLYVLSVLGVAIGVASVICIQIINLNALSAFTGSVKAISGDADFSIVGRLPTLDEKIYPKVLAQTGVRAAWPVYRIDVALKEKPDFFLEIVGFDFFAPVQLPLVDDDESETETDWDPDVSEVLTQSGWVAISPALAKDMRWSVGDSIPVTSGSRNATLRIGALVDFKRYAPLATRKLAVMDIAQAQSLLGRRGEIHQIDVQIEEDADAGDVMRRIEVAIGPSVMALTAEQRQRNAAGLLSAFRLNLTALSLISLFVGTFLIYSSTQAALVRRRSEFGMLRSLGSTPRQVLGLIVGEVVLLGLLGTLIGIPLGYWVAKLNVDRVSATLTNIYLLSEIESLHLPPWLFLLGAFIGIGGALYGALLPALDVSRRDTRSLLVAFTLHEKVGQLAPRLTLLSLLLAALTLGWYVLYGTTWRAGGFVLGFMLLVVLPLLTPQLIRTLCGGIHVSRWGLRYSLKNLGVRLQTTAFAIAALATAVSMLIGVTLLIGSFRKTLETWVDSTIRADIFITTPSWVRAGREAVLDTELIRGLSSHPQVADVEKLREFPVYVNGRRISLAGLDTALHEIEARIPLREGDPAQVWKMLRETGAVLVSEPLSRKEGLSQGDTLTISGAAGDLKLPIAGVSYDYSSEAGAALMTLDTMERLFGVAPINNIALYLGPDSDPERVIDQLRQQFPEAPLFMRSNRQLRAEIFEIFDQTFAITRILQVMALLVAVSGIALTLLVLARERVAELALYRALGALRRQIFRIFVGEGVGLALLGLLLGTVGGVGLALILIYIINPAYFGWSIRASWPGWAVLQEVATILGSAVLASIYPAIRASHVPAKELSRDDL